MSRILLHHPNRRNRSVEWGSPESRISLYICHLLIWFWDFRPLFISRCGQNMRTSHHVNWPKSRKFKAKARYSLFLFSRFRSPRLHSAFQEGFESLAPATLNAWHRKMPCFGNGAWLIDVNPEKIQGINTHTGLRSDPMGLKAAQP